MKVSYKLKAIKAAIKNILQEQYFVFDPGTPSSYEGKKGDSTRQL